MRFTSSDVIAEQFECFWVDGTRYDKLGVRSMLWAASATSIKVVLGLTG